MKDRPLVFACSGCSHAGELSDHVAREMDRREIAEMSCLAGVGAGKKPFLKKLQQREVWVIDGCPIHCSLGVFEQAGRPVERHIRLYELGIRKHDPPPCGEAFDRLVRITSAGAACAQAQIAGEA